MVKFDIEKIVLIGRTYREYSLMFKLDSVKGKILDCGSGVSSFTAEAFKKGYDVVAADPIYSIEPNILERKCKKDLSKVLTLAKKLKDQYVWKFFKDITMLKRYRERAYKLFIEDYKKKDLGIYNPVNLPKLPFRDHEFSLTLCSHLLFLYDDRLDYKFHKDSILELLRISDEVRIFPLVNLNFEKSKYVNDMINEVSGKGYKTQIVKVPYEFVKGGNEMLRISKN